MTALSIYVTDLKSVPNKIPSIIRDNLPRRGQRILGTQWVYIPFTPELDSLRLCSLNIPHEERIGTLIDMLVPIRNRLNESTQGKVGRGGALRDEDLGSSPCDIMLQEG